MFYPFPNIQTKTLHQTQCKNWTRSAVAGMFKHLRRAQCPMNPANDIACSAMQRTQKTKKPSAQRCLREKNVSNDQNHTGKARVKRMPADITIKRVGGKKKVSPKQQDVSHRQKCTKRISEVKMTETSAEFPTKSALTFPTRPGIHLSPSERRLVAPDMQLQS